MHTGATFSFPVVSFRNLETPFGRDGHRDYFATVAITDLPDLSEWRTINIRDPKLTGAVPRAIRASVEDNPELFMFMNRGITLSVKSASFDNRTSELALRLTDKDLHGLLDGGHTYNILREAAATLDHLQYVRVEVLEGFNAEEILDIVEARNTSNQVRPQSLMNLAGNFNKLKVALEGESYAGKVAYKEYELLDEEGAKPIDVREIVAILTVFDRDHFNKHVHPIDAYRSKAACLKHFLQNPKSYDKIYPLAADILRLYDEIQLKLPDLYNSVRGKAGEVSGGKFGKLTGVTVHDKKKIPLLYAGTRSEYSVPAGFIFPFLGAFRALVKERRGKYVWRNGTDPFELLEGEFGESLADTIGGFAREDKNPSKTGKSQLAWKHCYMTGVVEHAEHAD